MKQSMHIQAGVQIQDSGANANEGWRCALKLGTIPLLKTIALLQGKQRFLE